MELVSKSSVMIVDDVESEIDILVDILKEYEVSVVMDGESALEVAREVCPDLILLDILMPGMDGYEVCRRLKQDPRTREIPIIFVTVLSEEGDEATGLGLGALDYITKPYNRDIVLARVKNYLALIKAHRLKEDVNRIISHDMRNELSTIINYPDILLLDPGLDDEQREMLDRIRTSGYNLLGLVGFGLQLYRMEQGLYSFRPGQVDALKIIRRILANKEMLCKAKALEPSLTCNGSPAADNDSFMVLSEELLLYSMLSNLIINALEASPAGNRVEIALTGDSRGSVIRIHNTGAVPLEIRKRFFEKYVTAGKEGGTGLGAYSALLMARTHGGTIDMETSEEAGTAVTVSLPG